MRRDSFGNTSEVVVPATANWQCNAYGCRLPGGLSQGFGPEAKYYCRFHYGKEPFENDLVTRILHSYNAIFDAIYAIRDIEDVTKIAVHFDGMGRSDLAPLPDEALLPHYYRDRLMKMIGQEITEEIKHQKEARAK
jgi:hypothetical protein